MWRRAVGILRSPASGARLTLEPLLVDGDHVWFGRLRDDGGHLWWPILEGIPRLIDEEWWPRLLLPRFGPELKELGWQPVGSFVAGRLAETTMISRFGAEWAAFPRIDIQSTGLFDSYFDLVDVAELSSLSVLDAGCGMGRWASHAAKYVDELVAIDLSGAVEQAYANLAKEPNVHVVQADITRLPFGPESFDLVYSLGVLHHLPEPREGLKELRRVVRQGGRILTYLYYSAENRPKVLRALLRATTFVRKATSRLPRSLLFSLCALIATFIYWPCIRFGGVVQSVLGERVSKWVPLYSEVYAGRGWRAMFLNAVDRFGTPIEHRFARAEVGGILRSVGFKNVRLSDTPPYWKSIAER